mmetsp:Transcript_93423/g.204468  ORF Transcript_93423/g.204468 Transcript_93423/m.204468 type:complete len:496 (-) Transcript_93423:424-1911(-)
MQPSVVMAAMVSHWWTKAGARSAPKTATATATPRGPARSAAAAAVGQLAQAASTSTSTKAAATIPAVDKRDTMCSARMIRLSVLVLLALQNCILMVVTSYSRRNPGGQYLASSAVAAAELLKLAAILLFLTASRGIRNLWSALRSEVFGDIRQMALLAVPSLFYTIQNNLWYVGMTNLDSVTAAVTSQLKVPCAALFSVLLLGKTLNGWQWLAILFLVVGLIVMNLKKDAPNSAEDDVVADEQWYRRGWAVLAMLLSCTSSGFAGVFSEYLIKGQTDVSVIVFNLRMQLFSVPLSFLGVASDLRSGHEFFEGWTRVTCAVVALNALGGIMVTMTMKHADNILKTFAVSMSLVLNCFISVVFLSAPFGVQDAIGVGTVIAGAWMYNVFSSSSSSSSSSSKPQESSESVAQASPTSAGSSVDNDEDELDKLRMLGSDSTTSTVDEDEDDCEELFDSDASVEGSLKSARCRRKSSSSLDSREEKKLPLQENRLRLRRQ